MTKLFLKQAVQNTFLMWHKRETFLLRFTVNFLFLFLFLA